MKGQTDESTNARIFSIVKACFKDKEFVEYFESFNSIKSQLIDDIKFDKVEDGSIKNIELINAKLQELEQKIKYLDDKFRKNNSVINFKELYESTSAKTQQIINTAADNEYKYIRALSQGIQQKSKPTPMLESIRAINVLDKNEGFKAALKQGDTFKIKTEYQSELHILKTVYEHYNSIESIDNKQAFYNSTIKKLVLNPKDLDKIFEVNKKIDDSSPYLDSQMRIISQKILSEYSYYNQEHGSITSKCIEGLISYKDINELFVDSILKNASDTVFVLFNAGNSQFVALCILKINSRLKVLCKNPAGNAHNDIKEKLKVEFNKLNVDFTNEDFISNTKQELKGIYNSGPMTLKNLEIICHILKTNGEEYLIQNFSNIEFCNSGLVREARKEHNNILINKEQEDQVKSHLLIKETYEEIARSTDIYKYKDTFILLLDKIDTAIKLDANNYKAIELKASILTSIADEYLKSGDLNEALLYIEKAVLTAVKNDGMLQKKAVIEIELAKKNALNQDIGTKTQEELIKELEYLNKENNSFDVRKINDDLNKTKLLIQKYNACTKADILSLAQGIRKEPHSIEIPEYIAIIDRANYIDTFEHSGVGHHLRDTQILSVLSFFSAGGNGRLAQIKTGEGKSTIVSVLAIIKALQGNKVDILTSSQVLAERDVKEKESLYSLFNLNVADNGIDANYVGGPKECYEADILYGSISNFQFDLLRHEHQSLNTRGKKQNERKFDVVIIDEADSMLIDNGGHLAKLSSPLPGMEYLQPILVYIWSKVAELSPHMTLLTQLTGKTINEIENAKMLKDGLINDVRKIIQDGTITLPRYNTATQKIDNKECAIFIPKHLNGYIEDQADKWVSHAFNAAFIYKQDREYIIKTKDGETIIAPVDHSNTGTVQIGTIWSDGLHQFLQLKHGLRLTAESCNTSFISNIGYIKRYIKDQKDGAQPSIFGLTGTLGGVQERDLLSKSYDGLDSLNIPTYKKKVFEKESTILKKSDEEWLDAIVTDTVARSQTRAILIICDAIEEAKKIYNLIKDKLGETRKLKLYLEDDQTNVTEEKMEVGNILIATNLAGRGTDIKTSSELEKNGGLHVCVTFMPANERVEDQALGRTSRQGKKGTAQLIIKEDKFVKELKVYVDEYLQSKSVSNVHPDNYVQMLEVLRNETERQRVCDIAEKRLNAINVADDLFNKFSRLCVELKSSAESLPWYHIVIRAIEERWGFWLKKLDLNNKDIIDEREVGRQFQLFVEEIRKKAEVHSEPICDAIVPLFRGKLDVNINKYKPILDVIENPYYLISIGQFCFRDRNFEFAKIAFEKAIFIANDMRVAASAHYLLAFTEIQLIRSAEDIVKKAIKAIAPFINFNEGDREHAIHESIKHLQIARDGIKGIQDIYTNMMHACTTFPIDNKWSSDNSTSVMLITHLMSKINLFNLYNMYIDMNRSSIEQCNPRNESISIKKKASLELDNISFGGDENHELKRIEDHFKKTIKYHELKEVASIGFKDICYVGRIRDIPPQKAYWIDGQIAAGLAMYASAIAFPPAALILCPLGSTCIGEGISDLICTLAQYCFSDDDIPFDAKGYNKQKAKSLAKNLALAGVGAIAQMANITKEAISTAEKVYKTLEKIPLRDLEKLSFREILSISLEALGYEDIKKIVDIVDIKNFDMSNIIKIVNVLPNTDVKWLNCIKDFAGHISEFANAIQSGNLMQMLSTLPQTDIKELENIRTQVGQITRFYDAVKTWNIQNIIKNIPANSDNYLGIKGLNDVVHSAKQIGIFLSAVQLGNVQEMLKNIPHDLKLNIKEFDSIANSAKHIGEFYNIIKGRNIQDIIDKIPADLNDKMPELNNMLKGINQVREFCIEAKKGNFINIMNIDAFSNIHGEIKELRTMLDYMQQIQILHTSSPEKTFVQIHNAVSEETREIFSSFLGDNFDNQ